MYCRNNSWHCCIFTNGSAGAVGFGDFCKAANDKSRLVECRLACEHRQYMPVTVVGGGGGDGEIELGATAVLAYSTS